MVTAVLRVPDLTQLRRVLQKTDEMRREKPVIPQTGQEITLILWHRNFPIVVFTSACYWNLS